MICPNCKVECFSSQELVGKETRIAYQCPLCVFKTYAHKLKFKEIFVFVALDDLGNEGIPAAEFDGKAIPLISGDASNCASMRIIAEKIAKNSKTKIKLLRFSNREVLEEFGG